MTIKKYVTEAGEFHLGDTGGLPPLVTFKVHTRTDPEDGVLFTSGDPPNLMEVTTTWTHMAPTPHPMDADFLAQNVMFDLEDREARERLATVLARVATEFREFPSVWGAEWTLDGGEQIVTWFCDGTVPPGAGALLRTEEFSPVNISPWEPVDLDEEAVVAAHAGRTFANVSRKEHGVAHPDVEIHDGGEPIPSKSMVLADTLGWSNPKTVRSFLGYCKFKRCNVYCCAASEDYVYGNLPDWVTINSRSRVGVIDMLRPGVPVDFPSVGMADYVKLDYRCPQFAYHLGRMIYNPVVQIIVVLHDTPADVPLAMEEDGKSKLHQSQFVMVAESCASQNNRKPVLFRVADHGVAMYLRRCGVHVSPTVEDCMEKLRTVLEIYMASGDVQHGAAEVEEVAENVV
jgi:hypothetical protein